jgi:hypothetical protein
MIGSPLLVQISLVSRFKIRISHPLTLTLIRLRLHPSDIFPQKISSKLSNIEAQESLPHLAVSSPSRKKGPIIPPKLTPPSPSGLKRFKRIKIRSQEPGVGM